LARVQVLRQDARVPQGKQFLPVYERFHRNCSLLQRFDGHKFLDEKGAAHFSLPAQPRIVSPPPSTGVTHTCAIQFAPFQRVARKQAKPDPKMGTIEQVVFRAQRCFAAVNRKIFPGYRFYLGLFFIGFMLVYFSLAQDEDYLQFLEQVLALPMQLQS
jgi:hypothetical protein